MHSVRAIAETVHLTSLGVWLGAMGIAGAAAAVAFPVMRNLEPTLGAYSAFPDEHWPIAAGEVLFRVFQISDLVAMICLTLVVGSLIAAIVAGGLSMRRLSVKLRIALAIALLVIQSWSMFVLTPRMVGNVAEFWSAARIGDVERAGEYRVLFNNDHPTSRRVSETLMVFILISMVAAGASLSDGRKRKAAE